MNNSSKTPTPEEFLTWAAEQGMDDAYVLKDVCPLAVFLARLRAIGVKPTFKEGPFDGRQMVWIPREEIRKYLGGDATDEQLKAFDKWVWRPV